MSILEKLGLNPKVVKTHEHNSQRRLHKPMDLTPPSERVKDKQENFAKAGGAAK